MKFSHRVTEARWDESATRWAVTVQDADDTTIHDECDVFISAIGVLNAWEWPSIPGLGDYQGKLMHSAAWDESFDLQVCIDCLFYSTFRGSYLTRASGQNRGRYWSWFQRYSDCANDSAKGQETRPLRSW